MHHRDTESQRVSETFGIGGYSYFWCRSGGYGSIAISAMQIQLLIPCRSLRRMRSEWARAEIESSGILSVGVKGPSGDKSLVGGTKILQAFRVAWATRGNVANLCLDNEE